MADLEARQREVFSKLQDVLISLLKVMKEKDETKRPVISMETDLIEELGIDSLESMDLMNAIEDEFNISPNLNVVNSKTKINQIVDYIIELEDERDMSA